MRVRVHAYLAYALLERQLGTVLPHLSRGGRHNGVDEPFQCFRRQRGDQVSGVCHGSVCHEKVETALPNLQFGRYTARCTHALRVCRVRARAPSVGACATRPPSIVACGAWTRLPLHSLHLRADPTSRTTYYRTWQSHASIGATRGRATATRCLRARAVCFVDHRHHRTHLCRRRRHRLLRLLQFHHHRRRRHPRAQPCVRIGVTTTKPLTLGNARTLKGARAAPFAAHGPDIRQPRGCQLILIGSACRVISIDAITSS